MLNYTLLIGQILLIIKVIIFVILEIIWRPTVLRKYNFIQKIKMGLDPLPGGRAIISSDDWSILKWYRFGWLTILALLIIKLVIATAVWLVGLYHPELL